MSYIFFIRLEYVQSWLPGLFGRRSSPRLWDPPSAPAAPVPFSLKSLTLDLFQVKGKCKNSSRIFLFISQNTEGSGNAFFQRFSSLLWLILSVFSYLVSLRNASLSVFSWLKSFVQDPMLPTGRKFGRVIKKCRLKLLWLKKSIGEFTKGHKHLAVFSLVFVDPASIKVGSVLL